MLFGPADTLIVPDVPLIMLTECQARKYLFLFQIPRFFFWEAEGRADTASSSFQTDLSTALMKGDQIKKPYIKAG